MHPHAENWIAIGRVVVYYARQPRHLVHELNVGNVATALTIRISVQLCKVVSMMFFFSRSVALFKGNFTSL